MEYKRLYRQMSDETKQKISQSLKGKTKSMTHKDHIKNSLRNYWEHIPNRPDVGQNNS